MRLSVLTCFYSLLALPAFAEVPRVVTDIPPVHALVAQVMGELGKPILLLEPGAEEHDFQLRPSQMQEIEKATLIVWIGPGLTPWLDRASQGSPAANLSLLTNAGTLTQPFAADHDDPDHGASGIDPHAWLNPTNAMTWLTLIAAELAKSDPGNAAVYRANADRALTEIAALDARIAAMLAPVADAPFVTYHDAYGYFATHYGLRYVGSVADGEAANPGAAHLTELQKRLTTDKVRCLFPEAQHDPDLATQLLVGTPTRLGKALDPTGSSLPPGPGAYGALLEGLAASLTSCLRP